MGKVSIFLPSGPCQPHRSLQEEKYHFSSLKTQNRKGINGGFRARYSCTLGNLLLSLIDCVSLFIAPAYEHECEFLNGFVLKAELLIGTSAKLYEVLESCCVIA